MDYEIPLSIDSVMMSIEHLCKAMDLVIHVNNSIVDDKVLDFLILVENLNKGWIEVNKCRIYTESLVDFEEQLIPSMGLINDAKCMLESLVAWRLGMTVYGKYNIIRCLRMACLDHINPVITELEFWLDVLKDRGDDAGLVQCIVF